MPFPLSLPSINAIAEVVSGGSANYNSPPSIGIYPTGWEIEQFMSACNVPFEVSDSRVSSLSNCLMELNNNPKAKQVFPLAATVLFW